VNLYLHPEYPHCRLLTRKDVTLISIDLLPYSRGTMSRNSPPLRDQKFHYRNHRCPQPVPILSQISGSLSPQHGASSGCGWRDGHQLRRIATNVLNKQSPTADTGWSSSLGVWLRANNSSP